MISTKLTAEGKQLLETLLQEFSKKIRDHVCDAHHLLSLTDKQLSNCSDYCERWIIARACFRSTISLKILSEEPAHLKLGLRPFAPQSFKTNAQGREKDGLAITNYMNIAIMWAAEWKKNRSYSFRYCDGTFVITPPSGSIKNWQALLEQAQEYVLGRRFRTTGGGGNAREWAGFIRGLAGACGLPHSRDDKSAATLWDGFFEKIHVIDDSFKFPLSLLKLED